MSSSPLVPTSVSSLGVPLIVAIASSSLAALGRHSAGVAPRRSSWKGNGAPPVPGFGLPGQHRCIQNPIQFGMEMEGLPHMAFGARKTGRGGTTNGDDYGRRGGAAAADRG